MMVGRGVGPVGLAALNLLLPVFSVYMGTGILFGVGGGVLFSVCRGRGEEEKAREYFTAALILAVCASIFFVVLFTAFFDPITRFLGRNEATDAYVREYGRFLKIAPPMFVFSSFLQAFVRNDGAPKLAMAGVVTGGISNVIMDYVFIFPLNMGMGGAAFATVLGCSLTVLILCLHFFSKNNTLKIVKPRELLSKCREVIHHGFASFLLEESSGIIIFLFNRQLLRYVGDLGVVVYGIVSNSALVVTSINNGICQASQPILAVNFGAARKDRVAQAFRYGMTAAGIGGVLFTAIGLFFPKEITALFVEPAPEILEMSVEAVRLYFLSFLFLGFNMLFSTYFQSVMKPGQAMAICLMRGFIINSILVMVLPMALGVTGIWTVMLITEAVTLITGLYLKGRTYKTQQRRTKENEKVL